MALKQRGKKCQVGGSGSPLVGEVTLKGCRRTILARVGLGERASEREKGAAVLAIFAPLF